MRLLVVVHRIDGGRRSDFFVNLICVFFYRVSRC